MRKYAFTSDSLGTVLHAPNSSVAQPCALITMKSIVLHVSITFLSDQHPTFDPNRTKEVIFSGSQINTNPDDDKDKNPFRIQIQYREVRIIKMLP